jgi:hypothetical protein
VGGTEGKNQYARANKRRTIESGIPKTIVNIYDAAIRVIPRVRNEP